MLICEESLEIYVFYGEEINFSTYKVTCVFITYKDTTRLWFPIVIFSWILSEFYKYIYINIHVNKNSVLSNLAHPASRRLTGTTDSYYNSAWLPSKTVESCFALLINPINRFPKCSKSMAKICLALCYRMYRGRRVCGLFDIPQDEDHSSGFAVCYRAVTSIQTFCWRMS